VTRRILVTILAVTTLAVALFGIPLALSVRRLYNEEAVVRLEREAAEAGIAVPASFAQTGDPVELPEPGAELGLGLYDESGARITGQGPPRADEEVSAALRGDVRSGRESGSLVVAVPLTSEEKVFAAIRASVPYATVDARIHRTWLAMAALAAGALATAGALAWRQARRLSRPVEALADAATRLGHGDFSARAATSGVAEVDAAAAALNTTAGRLGELVSRERSFSADASHQLRTPLTRVRLRLEAALGTPVPDHAEAIRAALGDIDHLEATVEELLALARDVGPQRERLDVPALLEEVEARWHGNLAVAGRPLRVVVESGLPPVDASAAALRHVLDVLLENAAEHGAGTVTVSARATAGALAIDVADEGPGPPIPEEKLFHRRSQTALGRGIGLALARSLADAEGGRLVLSRAGPAPCFTVLLPGSEPGEGPIG
jgi:signal transduction histidine kinase